MCSELCVSVSCMDLSKLWTAFISSRNAFKAVRTVYTACVRADGVPLSTGGHALTCISLSYV